jgi:anti-anti-sigma factor
MRQRSRRRPDPQRGPARLAARRRTWYGHGLTGRMAPAAEGAMAFRTDKIGDVVVVMPEGSFTGGRETDQFESELRRHIQANQKKILLDLRGTSHLSSVPIGMLVGVHTSATNRGLHLFMCNIERRIDNVLVVLKLINVFNVFDTREQALEAFKKK